MFLSTVAIPIFLMIHMCADMCAAEHARPYITCRATSTAVCLLVVIRTRSRTGGARGGEGRPYFVYARCYRKEGRGPLHPVHHAAYSSFSLPQLEYDGGGHKKKTNIGLLLFRFVPVSSCRTKGPFEILMFLIIEQSNFVTNHQVSPRS